MGARLHSDHLGPCPACGHELSRRAQGGMAAEAEHLIMTILGRLDRDERLAVLNRIAAVVR